MLGSRSCSSSAVSQYRSKPLASVRSHSAFIRWKFEVIRGDQQLAAFVVGNAMFVTKRLGGEVTL